MTELRVIKRVAMQRTFRTWIVLAVIMTTLINIGTGHSARDRMNGIGGERLIPGQNPTGYTDTSSMPAPMLKAGDLIQLGQYRNEPMLWRVLEITPDREALLYAERVIALKAFDADTSSDDRNGPSIAESDNDYASSTLRQWLNSESVNRGDQLIVWEGTPPAKPHIWRGLHPYDSEAGFLSDDHFTLAERVALLPYRLEGKSGTILQDRVFLLSDSMWRAMVEGTPTAKAMPTKTLVEQSRYQDEASFNSQNAWNYWLSSPVDAGNSLVSVVLNDGSLWESDAYNDLVGVRPAVCLDADVARWAQGGDGSSGSPYKLQRGADVIPPTAPEALVAGEYTRYSVRLSWQPAIDNFEVERYYIYHRDQLLVSTDETSVLLASMNEMVRYQLTVRARDRAGNLSPPSPLLALQLAEHVSRLSFLVRNRK